MNHYEEAERCLLEADQVPEQATHWLLAAQTHGTLALVEAQRITAEQIAQSNAIALADEIGEVPWNPRGHVVEFESIADGLYAVECRSCGPIDTVEGRAEAERRSKDHIAGKDQQ